MIEKNTVCRLLVVLLVSLGLCYALNAQVRQHRATYNFAPLTQQIQAWVSKGYYPGASMLIAKDGDVIYEQYFGTYKPETPVYIASAGKWLAAATIAAVVDDGKLSWDDKVVKWLPDWTDAKSPA